MLPNLALIDAAKYGELGGVADALRRGADANTVVDHWTPLMWAAQEGHTDVVSLLLDAGADVNFTDPGGFTPLKQAISDSHLDTAEHLLLRGADVSHRCSSDGGCTVLHSAAAYGRLDCIRLLLLYGADPRALNDDGQTPYDTAVQCWEPDAALLLQLH